MAKIQKVIIIFLKILNMNKKRGLSLKGNKLNRTRQYIYDD